MERFVGEVGEGRSRRTGARNPPYPDPAAVGSREAVSPADEVGTGEPDSCIGGPRMPTTELDHRGILGDVEFPELFDALHEIEQFVRRNPWPMLALGFAAGYWWSRSKAR